MIVTALITIEILADEARLYPPINDCFLLQACKSQPIKITDTQRDTSITQSNSFSELFVDSIKVESFITEQWSGQAAAMVCRIFDKNQEAVIH
ncbi:MAG: hypothetical protein JWQ09_2451 [Segetibacter sp.]|nr:hypothetical protein [Segetibacter sp.]